MILAVDAGNSRTKWGLFDSEGRLLQDGSADNVALAALLPVWAALPAVRRAVVSCVAGEAVSGQLQRHFSALQWSAHWISASAAACGVRNGYRQPTQLGSDRWAALVAAWHRQHGPCVVANAGTALTVDALSGSGEFLGGLIVPGLELMRGALGRGTAGVAPVAGSYEDFPAATAEAVHSGALAAMAGAIRHMVDRLAAREGRPPACLLGGGAAPALAAVLDFPVEPVPQLVLQGLFLLESASS